MRVTLCPASEPNHRSPSFDLSQFGGSRKRPANLTYADLSSMHTVRPSDPRKGRRLPVPDWALSDETLREAVVRYCEQRFLMKDRTGSLQERMQRVSEASRIVAQKAQARTDLWIKNVRAIANRDYHLAEPRTYTSLFLNSLRGESPAV